MMSLAFKGIGVATFGGSGLSDMTPRGTFSGSSTLNYKVQIDSQGTPDTFKWSDDGGSTWDATGVAITGSAQNLNNGVTITFHATTGHTTGGNWIFSAFVVTMGVEDLTETHTGKVKQIPAPGINPILVALGYEGPEFIIQGLVVSEVDYNSLKSANAGTIVTISTSTYTEFTVAENYHLTKKKVSRKGGSVGIWIANLTLTRKWS